MLLKGKKGGQEGAPKRKLKNLLLRTRKLENLADENEIELESKENIKKWSSKSNPSKLAWLLRLKKGNKAHERCVVICSLQKLLNDKKFNIVNNN